jgi:UDP-glucose 4-epimerase
MRRIVITGGLGYVGHSLVMQAIEAGDVEVHVIDNLACGPQRLTRVPLDRFHLHVADITDGLAIRTLMGKIQPDVIFHLAAIHYIPLCEAEPGHAVSVNVAGTVNLLDAAPLGCVFVFASTAAVYAPEDDAHVEDTSLIGPMDIYGWTKIHGEEFVKYYHGLQKVVGVIVRLFNVVGSGETNPHLAPAIIEQLDDGVASVKLGNLFPHRDYIDVTDAAGGFLKLAAVGATRTHYDELLICNLGTGRSNEVGDVVRLIAKAAGIDLAIDQDAARVRAVDRPMLKASTTRLEALTGWKPTTTLEESMARAWATRALDKLVA